ncbi:hypothetical protein BRC81_05980 [Halobacteriales archaeon QS_1_68_20]|nr:MAG: hypothetical protein BRC81_05980 [Halobacteriales archaeon QS_1_68_20]
MEESISGFKVRGTWGDVVEHGERVTRALREAGLSGADVEEDEVTTAETPPAEAVPVDLGSYEDAFEEWNEWRPRAHERIEEEVPEKTAEQARIDEGEGEKAGKNPGEDMQTAGEKLAESYEKLDEGDDEAAVDSWQDSMKYAARAADSAGRKAIRKVEDTVYKRVMTQLAPYYFDNELVSANLQKTARGDDDERFVFEVNVNDDDLKGFVSERLGEYEDAVTRWHVDTEKQTETVEAAEGVEAPREEIEDKSKSTTN